MFPCIIINNRKIFEYLINKYPLYCKFNRIKKPQVGVPPLDPDIIIPEIYDVLRDYDYRTLNDSLTPPYKGWWPLGVPIVSGEDVSPQKITLLWLSTLICLSSIFENSSNIG